MERNQDYAIPVGPTKIIDKTPGSSPPPGGRFPGKELSLKTFELTSGEFKARSNRSGGAVFYY
jgi:hypothetical protein